MPDLKPCPFCGPGKINIYENHYHAWTECNNCRARGPIAKTLVEAIELWNERSNT